jgi:lysophospholipase L1-like esterase
VARHSTGITIALTAALAFALSFAPLPDAWRPLPPLAEKPWQTLAEALLPRSISPFERQDAITGARDLASAPGLEDTPPGSETPPLSPELDEPVPPTTALTPAAGLDALEAREARKLEAWARKVGARHVDIEQSCREKNAAAGECLKQSLDVFFERVEAIRTGERFLPVRVVHLGDSQIASDFITDLVRRRLEMRYGSGGRGFLFVDRPTPGAGRKVRTGEASEGWEVVKLTDSERSGPLGFSGVRFVSRDGRNTRFRLEPAARVAEVHFATSPRGGTVYLNADQKTVSKVLTRFTDSEFAFTRIWLPRKARTLELRASKGDVNLFGVALESGGPGIVYDTVGLPGAFFEVYLRAPEKVFRSQLRRRNPSLVVLMLGGNDAYEIGRGRQTLDKVRESARKLVERIQKAAPSASCLLMSPMDAGVRTVSGGIEPRQHNEAVGKVVREVAMEKGCAFWNLYQAMGGAGSVGRWLDRGLLNEDLVHPLGRGADLLGHLFDFALERARTRRPNAPPPRQVEPAGLEDSSGKALARTFAKLEELAAKNEQAPRVSVVQLGASHTAGHMFTDAVRTELGKKFGSGGRGFVAAGRPSNQLARSGVKRELLGNWQMLDARDAPAGEPMGLTGIRAVGQPGAMLRTEFGIDEPGGNAPAQVSVSYLETPAMGRMSVRIDGVVAAELSGPEKTEALPAGFVPLALPDSRGRARVVSFPVEGTSHVVEVKNMGGGPISVFGTAVDELYGGVGWDALGLPGSTAILADTYEKAVMEEQLRARKADLYVLFFGTNESANPAIGEDELRRANVSLLRTLRTASPEADCLILGPTDRLEKKQDGRWEEAPNTEMVIRVLREIAQQQGCAFWSSRAAMGGPRAMTRWQQMSPPWGHEDGIHLTREGYERLASALVNDLLEAYR